MRRGETLTEQELISRLNDLGYAQRPDAQAPGEFAIIRNAVLITPRTGDFSGKTIRATFPAPAPPARGRANARPAPPPRGIMALDIMSATSKPVRTDAVTLDPPLLTALITSGAREKRRRVSLDAIPKRMQQAVLAIEDQGFYYHPGINPFRIIAAAVTNVFGSNRFTVGNSTITQQLARMFFLADEFNAELQTGTRGRTLAPTDARRRRC